MHNEGYYTISTYSIIIYFSTSPTSIILGTIKRMVNERKVVVITGANRGIGFEFCNQLLTGTNPLPNFFNNNPISVIACVRSLENIARLQELKNTLEQSSGDSNASNSLIIMQCDVSNQDHITKFTRDLQEVYGITSIDLFISNAGIIEADPQYDISDVSSFDEPRDIFTVNTIAPVLLTNALIPFLKASAAHTLGTDIIDTPVYSSVADGVEKNDQNTSVESSHKYPSRCIYISSNLGSITNINTPLSPSYRASKAALNAYVKAFQLKYPFIGFLPISPGWVGMFDGCGGGIVLYHLDYCMIYCHYVIGWLSMSALSYDLLSFSFLYF